MPDPAADFFEDDGLALQGTAFSRVYPLTAPKRKEWTREDEENYDLSILASQYLRDMKEGTWDE